MRGGSRFRRAVGLSVGLHLLLAAGLVVLGRWQASRPDEPCPMGIDTSAGVTVRLIESEATAPTPVAVEEPADTSPPLAQTEPDPPEVTPQPEPVHPSVAEAVPEPGAHRPPLAHVTPRPLPPELLALMRRPPTPAVTEVPLDLPPIRSAPAPDPGPVRPAAATVAKPSPLDGGKPLHGALGAGQTVVYALDASGSMGEFGKFDAARRALVATLRRQPEAVHFQVVVYAGSALVPLPAGAGRCVPATTQNVARMADVLLALGAPAGHSDHPAALRLALGLTPDVVVFLSDVDGPPPAAFRQLARRAVVCVARVGPAGVADPVEWK